jgi:hypothetical protein
MLVQSRQRGMFEDPNDEAFAKERMVTLLDMLSRRKDAWNVAVCIDFVCPFWLHQMKFCDACDDKRKLPPTPKNNGWPEFGVMSLKRSTQRYFFVCHGACLSFEGLPLFLCNCSPS